MQTLYVDGKKLSVIRSFTAGPGKVTVLEVENGFCYLDGNMVFDRAHLQHLPKEHKPRAFEWFEKTYGDKTKRAESVGNVLEEIVPEQEPQDEGIREMPELPGLVEELESL